MKKSFKGICIALALLSTVSMAACGSNDTAGSSTSADSTATASSKAPAENIKLSWYRQYSTDNDKVIADYAITELKKEIPNIEFDIIPNPQDTDQKIKTMAATGELPDIMTLNPTLVGMFSKSNNILTLDKYVDEMGVRDQLQDGAKSLLDQGDGHTYAIPEANSSFILMYYNKELFSQNGIKVPTNYAEFLAAVKAFKAKNITPVSFFSKEQWVGFSFMDALVTRTEPEGLKKVDSGKGDITEPAYLEAAKKFYELSKAGIAAKSAFTTAYDEAYSLFITGKAAMLLNGSWACADIGKSIGDNLGDKVGILPLTALADAKDVESSKGNAVGGGASDGVTAAANTKDKDIAEKVAVILGLKSTESKIVKGIESNTFFKADIKSEIPFNALQQEFADTVVPNVKNYTCFFWGMSNPKIATPLGENIIKLMVGSADYTPEKFIEETDKAIKASR